MLFRSKLFPSHDRGEVLFIGKTTYLIGYYVANNKNDYDECLSSFDTVERYWKLIPKEITITREVLEAAWNKTQNVNFMKVQDHYMKALCEELGF